MKKLLLAVFLFTAQSFAATYYVGTGGSDSNTTTQAQNQATPWKTITHAAGVVSAGDTVIVLDGTYQETVNFQRGGSSGSPVTFKSLNKWGAIIAPTSTQITGLSQTDVYINADYFTLDGFEIIGPSDGSAAGGVKNNGFVHVTISHNKVHRIGTQTTCVSGDAVGGGGDYFVIDGNYIYDVSPPRTAARCNQMHGIYVQNFGINGQAINNVVFEVYQGFGFQFGSFETHPINGWNVSNNTFFNDGVNTPGGGGSGSGGGIYYPCGASPYNCANNKFNNNIFESIQDVTFDLEFGTFGTTDQISNNVIHNSAMNNVTAPETVVNTISSDPLFINYTGDETGNYHLQSSSPAIDAGISAGAPSTDFDGNARPQGSSYDIGAYEYLTPGTGMTIKGVTLTGLTVGPPPPATFISLFPDTSTPPLTTSGDTGAYTLGVRWFSDFNGTVTKARYYKYPGNTGTHVGRLFTQTGNVQLANTTFSGESSTGWQMQAYSTPVPVCGNQLYIAAYDDPVGAYAETLNRFATQYDNAPLHAPASTSTSSYTTDNGIYSTGTNTSVWKPAFKSDYAVDLVFVRNDAQMAAYSLGTTSGPSTGGTSVQITGCNFTAGTTVTFGGTSASVTFNSATTITATAPAHAAGAVNVVVSDSGMTSTLPSAFNYTSGGTLATVTSISPNSAINTGGQIVTLTGSNFSGITKVNFGVNASQSFTVVNSTTITAKVPQGNPETNVNVNVTNGAGTSNSVNFFYGKVLFSDGFESGGFGLWNYISHNGNGGLAVCKADGTCQGGSNLSSCVGMHVHTGTWGACQHYVLPTGTSSQDNDMYMQTNMSGEPRHLFVRGYVWFATDTTVTPAQRKIYYNNKDGQSGNNTWHSVLDSFNQGSCLVSLTPQINPPPEGQNEKNYFTGYCIPIGAWSSVEQEIKLNTPNTCSGTAGDGLERVWINGTLQFENTAICVNGTSTQGFDYILIGQQVNTSGAAVNEHRYWDDIVIADAYIGP